MRKGGYEIINLNDLPLSTSETSTSVELYEKLLKSSKVILISSLNIDDKVYNDCFMFVNKKTDEIVLKNSAYIITVEDDGTITTAENTVEIPEITYETIYDLLETEQVDNENLLIIAKDTVGEKVVLYPNLSIIQKKLTTTNVLDGKISKSIGFDAQGNIVKGSAQLYLHIISVQYLDENTNITYTIKLSILSTSSTALNGYNLSCAFINGTVTLNDENTGTESVILCSGEVDTTSNTIEINATSSFDSNSTYTNPYVLQLDTTSGATLTIVDVIQIPLIV